MRIKKLDLYLARKFLSTFFFTVGLLVVVIVVIDVSEKIGDIVEHKTPWKGLIFEYYFNFIPWIINVLSPIFIFISVIFFTSNLTQKSEIVAILSSGVSYYRFLAPYLVVGCMLALFFFYLNGWVVPEATRKWTAFEKTSIRPEKLSQERNIHRKIDEGSYFGLTYFNQFDKIAYQVVLEQEKEGKLYRILKADRATWIDSTETWQLISLSDRYLVTPTSERVFYRPTLDTFLLLTPEDIYRRPNQTDMLTNQELAVTIKLEQDRGSEFVRDLVLERYERQAYPFTTLILTVMAVALSTKKRRGGIGLQLGLGLVLSFVFVILTALAKILVGDTIVPWLGMWLPNIIFTALAIFLIRIAPK